MLGALAAVAAVLAMIGAVYLINRPAQESGPGPVVAAPTPSLRTAVPSSAATTSAARTASPSPRPTATVRRIPVTVLNNSTRTGLAAAAADQLRSKHWPIRLVGNFTGRLPISSVYFASGEKPAALLLAKDFPAVQRVLPRFDGLPGHGLTLVVTREWPA